MDARGHGESDWVGEDEYSLEHQVDDLRAVVAALGKRPALVGASMGGVVSLVACGANADLASALVLVDVAPRLEHDGVAKIRSFMHANLDGFATLEEASEAVAAYNPTRPRPPTPAGLRKNLRQRDDGRWYWHWDPKMFAGKRHAPLAHMQERMLDAADRVRIPALLVRGKQSDVVSPAAVNELREWMSHLEYVDIEGAGHMIAGDRNDAFNSAILGFLSRHVPAGIPAAGIHPPLSSSRS
jgi:pimeloyl-ACP methyl ester carboxylesterase